MDGIKNLIFDFGGVLINLDRNACRMAFEQLGIESIHGQWMLFVLLSSMMW